MTDVAKTAVVRAVRWSRLMQLKATAPGQLSHGQQFIIGPRARFARGRRITVGDRVNIGANFTLQTHALIADDVMISSNVAFIGDDHPFDDLEGTIQDHPSRNPPRITLGGDNLIGYGTILIGEITIGRGAIVGAGSIVTGDIPPDAVCTGQPAKIRRARRRA